jgi:hypothetical protein
MILRDWAGWKNPEHPKQGLAITPKGWAVLKTMAAAHRNCEPGQVQSPTLPG